MKILHKKTKFIGKLVGLLTLLVEFAANGVTQFSSETVIAKILQAYGTVLIAGGL